MSCIDAPMERQALQPLTNKGAAGGLSRRKKANKRVDDEISITKRRRRRARPGGDKANTQHELARQAEECRAVAVHDQQVVHPAGDDSDSASVQGDRRIAQADQGDLVEHPCSKICGENSPQPALQRCLVVDVGKLKERRDALDRREASLGQRDADLARLASQLAAREQALTARAHALVEQQTRIDEQAADLQSQLANLGAKMAAQEQRQQELNAEASRLQQAQSALAMEKEGNKVEGSPLNELKQGVKVRACEGGVAVVGGKVDAQSNGACTKAEAPPAAAPSHEPCTRRSSDSEVRHVPTVAHSVVANCPAAEGVGQTSYPNVAESSTEETTTTFMSIDEFEKEMECQRKAAEMEEDGMGEHDDEPAQPRRRKSLRLQQRLAPVEKLNPTVDQGDFFSPLTSISALGDADTDMDNQGFNSRRRRHSVMPTRRTGRGSRASATFSPETVPATQQHNRRSVRTTSKRHKIKVTFAPSKQLVSAERVALAYDRTSSQPNLYSCDLCSRQFDAGLSGFEHYWHCDQCEDFDICNGCLTPATAMHYSGVHTFTEVDPEED